MSETSIHNRILFAGDPHGNFDSIIQAVLQYQPEAVVMLGDYSLRQALDVYLAPIAELTQIWWIYGNHDVASTADYANLFESGYKDYSLHLKVQEVAGLRIAGLGGIFMAKNWYPPLRSKWENQAHWLQSQSPIVKRSGMPLKLQHSIWQHEVAEMRATVKADILVTHEAPSCHRYGFAAIDHLADAIGARHIFHGHQHEYYNKNVFNGIAVTGVANAAVVNLLGQQLSKS
ncbi:MAG: metallophosphoesterase [Methylococcaceae bacterium]|nr:metallophosphoesterase [Methylococcaceae bacterium]